MKIKIHYGDGVINLPAALIDILPRADADALRVLLVLAGMHTSGTEIDKAALALNSGCDEAGVDAAIAFWRGAGVLSLADQKKGSAAKRAPKEELPTLAVDTAPSEEAEQRRAAVTVKASATALPAYTTEELAEILERRRSLTALVDECSRVFGKIFNTHEVSQIIGLSEYLGLEDEYLVLLLAHCARMGKKSLRYAVSTAISLYDEGITDTHALQECLKTREQRQQAEGQLRTMFGIGSRALTSKEKKMFDAWLFTHGFDLEVVRMAYERTVNATGKPSVPYANSILERWASEQLKTPEQIIAAEEAHAKQSASEPSAVGSSFDTDDFFYAALKRSYGEDYTPANEGKGGKA